MPDWLVGDPGRLRQILFNLLGNAVKFTAHGIEVSVCAEACCDDALTLLCSARHRHRVPAEMRDRIFEAFTQVDASTTREYGGTGLGLSIVRQLVSAMEGRIWFEEPDRGGSCFASGAAASGMAASAVTQAGASVVIAAGDPALRGVLAGWLEVWGLKARKPVPPKALRSRWPMVRRRCWSHRPRSSPRRRSRSAPVWSGSSGPCGRTAGARQRPRCAARILALRTAR